MKKRGQAAAFIIIGLIFLILLITFIAVKRGFLSDLFEGVSNERINVPQQVKPLQGFLDSCVNGITNEAVTLIGLQGGYIDLEEDEIPTTPFTPLGKNLEIFADSDFRTSVWFRERGNGIQELAIPTRSFMEDEIRKHVERNFALCVYNLTSFEDQGYIISGNGVPKANVQIGDGKISSVVNFPLNIKIKDTDFVLSEHRADIDSNLGKLHNMAIQIMESENEEHFLEQKTLDILVAYDPEVPFTGTDLSCNEKIWFKSEVEKRLKNIIFENVAAMRIKGSDYNLNDEKFKYLEFDALDNEDNEVNINLMYIPEWPTAVEISPSEGNVLRSDLISKKTGGAAATVVSSFFCLNHHRFVYDIKYPVLIILRDNSGFTFQYATEVIIDNNEPRENRDELINFPDPESQICKYPQKEVTVFTGAINSQGDLVPLENVSLNFKCFPASCPIGVSTINANGETLVKAKVPLCFNGILEGSKEGYKQIQKTIFSSNSESGDSLLVELEPLYKKRVNLFVIEKNTGRVREPYSTEQINFQFINKDTTYQTTYIYPNNDNFVELLPGNYLINSYLLRNSSTYKITIPKEKIETCIDPKDQGFFGLFGDKVCNSVETEAMDFDTILTGGATEVEYKFNGEDLAKDGALNLYILSSDIPSNFNELQKVQIEIETNKDHELFREPIIE